MHAIQEDNVNKFYSNIFELFDFLSDLVFPDHLYISIHKMFDGIDITDNLISAVVNTAAGMALDADGIAIHAGSGLEFDGSTGALKVTGFSTLASKFAGFVGNGVLTSIPVTHGLGTKDVQVTVYEVATGEEVIVDVARTADNVVTLGFAVAPSTNAYRVVVVA
jgi:hypothetical protein